METSKIDTTTLTSLERAVYGANLINKLTEIKY